MIVVGLSHQTAPIQVRERLAIAPDALGATLLRLREASAVGEVLVLSTCNRVEVYAAPRPEEDEAATLASVTRELVSIGGREVAPHLISRSGTDAVQHLFRVACSLDSLVVGEPQILGQLKDAFRVAQDAGTLGPSLQYAMQAALQSAKRVRTETQIGAGQVSVPSVAVDLAHQIFEDLSGQTTLVVGAGEMAEAAAKLLARAGARILVTNRSPQRAESLASGVGGRPVPWDQLDESLVVADIVVSSTASPTYVVTYDRLRSLRRKRRGRSLFLIDIAVPRDVEPTVNELDNVYLYDVDDLSHVVAQSLEVRRAEAEHAESIVVEELRGFDQRRSQQAAKPVIVALRERTRAILATELERSFKGRLKHLEERDKKALAVMLDAAVNKLLHAPTRHLKKLAEENRAADAATMLEQMFELELSAARALAGGPAPAGAEPALEAPPATAGEPSAAREEVLEPECADDASRPRAAAR